MPRCRRRGASSSTCPSITAKTLPTSAARSNCSRACPTAPGARAPAAMRCAMSTSSRASAASRIATRSSVGSRRRRRSPLWRRRQTRDGVRRTTMNRLDGKVALVTGAARGIGGETARLMVEAGARVVVADVLDEKGRETARNLGDAALYLHLDVTSEEEWNAAIAAAVGRFGKLDILVNNAGLFLGKDLETASLDEWHRLCAVNLTGVFLGTKLALPALRDAGRDSPHGSAIVNLASVAGLVGSTQDPLYSLTK